MPQGFPRLSHSASSGGSARDRLRDKPVPGKEIRNNGRPQHHQQQISLHGKKRLDKMRQEQTWQSLQPDRQRTE